MATVLQINSYNFASTGNIMMGIAKAAKENGYSSYTAVPYARTMLSHKFENQFFIGSLPSRCFHRWFSNISGYHGICSRNATRSFLKRVDEIHPDIIHLHNLHGSYINLPMLFDYLKLHNEIHVVWTLHDCWAFTGGCAHYSLLGCEKWKKECYNCAYKGYPRGRMDHTKQMFAAKKKWYGQLSNLEIVVPSNWLYHQVNDSFLSSYNKTRIYNGIDLKVFRPRKSRIREKYKIGNKFFILGVAFTWGHRKGLDVFQWLAQKLSEEYQIVLVGTNEEIDKKLPDNIISIHRTSDSVELAELYTAADVFVNPTREEVLGLVNIEALACGTPVITFQSGGSPECVNETCGAVIKQNDNNAMLEKIKELHEIENYSSEACVNFAQNFDQEKRFCEYVQLYDRLLDRKKS